MATKAIKADEILDTALRLAGASSWEVMRLHDVAAELGVTLDDIRTHFREKEDLVDAWFDRADAAMLRQSETESFYKLTGRQRLQHLIMGWLAALFPHRRATRQMIYGKFEPGHLHYQVAGLLRVSRTVQWMREAAGRKSVLPWRAIEESVLTSIYLMIFFFWMNDESENSRQTAALLERCLTIAETFSGLCSPLSGLLGYQSTAIRKPASKAIRAVSPSTAKAG